VDLSRRIREAGGRLIAAPSLYSTHHGDPMTLRAVFFSELWRGRDNLRVTLRERLSPIGLAGLGFTALYLVGLATLAVAWPMWRVGGPLALAVGLALLTALTATRVVRLWHAGGRLVEAVPFALAFDTARALALMVRVRHNTRRKA
jgi:hypothetical protein